VTKQPEAQVWRNIYDVMNHVETPAGWPILTSRFSALEPALSEAEGVGFHRHLKLRIFLEVLKTQAEVSRRLSLWESIFTGN